MLPIHLPLLRERGDDILLLIHHFLNVYKKDRDVTALAQKDIVLLKSYHWPGNVRELEQALRRILLTREYSGDPYATKEHPSAQRVGPVSLDEIKSLYATHQNYSTVGKMLGLDRRTVKKYLENPS